MTKQFNKNIDRVRRKFFTGIMSLLVGLFLLGHSLLKDKVETKSDLRMLVGRIKDYSLREYRSNSSHTYHYNLYLIGYKNEFFVPADWADYLNKDRFQRVVKHGDFVQFGISENDFDQLYKQKRVRIFEISDNSYCYLNSSQSLKIYNSDWEWIFGLACIIFGLFIFYYYSEKIILVFPFLKGAF